jgi:thioredoxin-like negative regulator of GroEL
MTSSSAATHWFAAPRAPCRYNGSTVKEPNVRCAVAHGRPWSRGAARWIVATLLALGASSPRGAAAEIVVWMDDWKAAKDLARREMRPILLDFAADWCAPCRAMDAAFWPREEVRALTRRFVLVRVDFDSQVGLRNRFAVHSIPNVVVLDPWENPLGRLTGWTGDAGVHVQLLRAVPESFGAFAADALAAAEGKADGSALERLGELYFPTPLAGASRSFLEAAVRSRELKQDPARRAIALSKIGWCDLRLADPVEARRRFEKALELKGAPADLPLAGLAVAWAESGNFDRAEDALRELRSSYPQSEMLRVADERVAKARAKLDDEP